MYITLLPSEAAATPRLSVFTIECFSFSSLGRWPLGWERTSLRVGGCLIGDGTGWLIGSHGYLSPQVPHLGNYVGNTLRESNRAHSFLKKRLETMVSPISDKRISVGTYKFIEQAARRSSALPSESDEVLSTSVPIQPVPIWIPVCTSGRICRCALRWSPRALLSEPLPVHCTPKYMSTCTSVIASSVIPVCRLYTYIWQLAVTT